MTKDITYCSSKDCPSKDCERKISNNHFEDGELISVSDLSGVCRYYIGWLASKVENDINP